MLSSKDKQILNTLGKKHKLNKDVTIVAGYFQMLASEGLEVVKNNFSGNGNNWAWLMITIKPTLFSSNGNSVKLLSKEFREFLDCLRSNASGWDYFTVRYW